MIDADGRLMTAISDICPSYNPDQSKPKGIESSTRGALYECKSWTQSQVAALGIGACLGCGKYDEHKKAGTLKKI